jgi:hypothetical protein
MSKMTDSFTKMSGDMVILRKDFSDLSENVSQQIKELKEMIPDLFQQGVHQNEKGQVKWY